LKILIITNSYPTKKNTVASHFVKEQVDSLINLNGKVFVFFNPIFNYVKNPQYKKGVLWTFIKYIYFTVAFIPFLLRKFDVVHCHQVFYPGFLGYIYCLLHNKPLIITSHGGDIDSMAKKSKIIFSLQKRIFRKASKVIAVSTPYENKLVKEFYVDSKKIEVISCGTNTKLFKPKKSRIQIKKNLGLNTKKIHLLFVGHLIDGKEPILFLKAINELGNKRIQPIIIGEGPLINKLKTFSKKNKIETFFKDYMPHEEVVKWMQASDMFIFPSSKESFGLVGVESLASGTPVIASKVGGKVDYLKEGYNGMFFKNKDKGDLKNKINQVLKNKKLYSVLLRNSISSVEKFSLENQAKKILRIYTSAWKND